MTVLRIEHTVQDYDAWKRAFDDDPVGRRRSGVTCCRILRDADDPDLVMIDLELGNAEEAQALLSSLRTVWGRVQGSLISTPRARIAESVETIDY